MHAHALLQEWFMGRKENRKRHTGFGIVLLLGKLTYTGCLAVFLPIEIRGTPPNQRMSDGEKQI